MSESSSLDFEVLRSIRRIVRGIAEHSRAISTQVGLTVPQLLCLKAVCEGPPGDVTMNYISRVVQLSPATVSGIVDRLVRQRVVERERRDDDRRKVWIAATEAGRETYAKTPSALQEDFVAKFNGLPEARRQELVDALREVEKLMNVDKLNVEPVLTSEAGPAI